jgi:signal transduction histidine kinase
MGASRLLLRYYVLLFFYGAMESTTELNFLTTLLPLSVTVFTITIGVILLNQHFRKNLYRQMLEQEELKNKHSQELLRSSIAVQEAERKRIAQDLHDEIGGLLTTSRIYFDQLKPGHTEIQLQQVSGKMNLLFDEMMINIRRISHDLRPIVLENLGLIEAIESLHEKLSENGVEFSFRHQLTFHLAKEVELNLYRIIQELIGNTIKHARSRQISITLKSTEDGLYFTYSDDGIGFDPDKASNGLGMKSIASRLNLLHGSMDVIRQHKGILFTIHIDKQQLYIP